MRGGLADHPHAGGENRPHRRQATPRSGPSPRGWGEPLKNVDEFRENRTIPTRVGRTGRIAHAGVWQADHPHAGGENYRTPWNTTALLGPSPRGWGELLEAVIVILGTRTIPTRVGRTKSPAFRSAFTTDHPHAGGENRDGDAVCELDVGPSPRGWGERCRGSWPRRFRRTIPTRVGRTA